MKQLKYIVKFLVSLVSKADETWAYLDSTKTEEANPDYQQHNFHYPLLAVMAFLVMLFGGFYAADEDAFFDLQKGMTGMVPLLVAFFVGPYLAISLLKWICSSSFYHIDIDKEKLTLFVFYSTGFLMAMEIMIALVPSIQFVKLFRIYIIYIALSGVNNYLHINQKRAWGFTFISAFCIYFCPTFIHFVLTRLQG